MDVLTREQAIKRIRDISHIMSCKHLEIDIDGATTSDRCLHDHILRVGATRELMAIFEITEDELS